MALSFDGVDQYVLQGSAFGGGALDDFAISLWVRTTETAGGDGANDIYGVVEDGTAGLVQAQLNTDEFGAEAADELGFNIRRTGGTPVVTDVGAFTNTDINDGEWHHHCLVRDGAASTYYIDGVSQTITYRFDDLDAGQIAFARPMAFAARNVRGTIGAFADVDLAEIGIYTEALSSGKIASLAEGASPILLPVNLLNYYDLIGGRLIDRVGGNNLTAVNSPVKTDHPRIIYPHRRRLFSIPAAGGLSIPIAAYHYNHHLGSMAS